MSEKTTLNTLQDEVLTFLLSAPTLQQIVAFHASEAAQLRVRELLEANRNSTLSPAEHAELDEASHLNHFIGLLKARAHQELQQQA